MENRKIIPRTLKGFRDFLPQESRKRQYVIKALKEVFESYGFEPLETPALEYEDILLGKYGEEGDKLMYRFEDNGLRKVALRYDQTVPLARVAAQYSNDLPSPFKRYQMQNVWRAENTQKGRFREFLQCDIDTINSQTSFADAEIIACAYTALKKLGFTDFKIYLNDRNIFQELTKSTIITIDKLKKIGREKVVEELVTRGEYDSSETAQNVLIEIEQTSPTPWINEVIEKAKMLGVPQENLEFNPFLARGLDYYTSTIIEVEAKEYTAGSLGGGGRYDNLIGMFGGQSIPAVGFAFGFDRLLEAMEELGLFPQNLETTKALVTVFSEDLLSQTFDLTQLLRRSGINTEIYLDSSAKMEKQLKYADKKKIPYVLILGPEELQNNEVTVKNLTNRTQERIIFDNLVSFLNSN